MIYTASRSSGRRPSSRRRGFSFIEMLTVLVIVALVGKMSMGRIALWLTKSRIERAAQTTSQDLSSAFALARRNSSPVVVTFNTWASGDSIRLRLASRGGTVYRNRYFGLRSQFGFKASEVSATSASFEVHPFGVATVGDTITFTRNGTTRRVIMTRAGIVTVDK
jgi:prepilin-type N-terminal cleavage/methylation domain-containing protein